MSDFGKLYPRSSRTQTQMIRTQATGFDLGKYLISIIKCGNIPYEPKREDQINFAGKSYRH